MNTELKQLIEDAAKLLEIYYQDLSEAGCCNVLGEIIFNPCDPERGDLMKVAEAAELCIDARENEYFVYYDECVSKPAWFRYTKGNYKSLVYAVLRAASAVLKARGE